MNLPQVAKAPPSPIPAAPMETYQDFTVGSLWLPALPEDTLGSRPLGWVPRDLLSTVQHNIVEYEDLYHVPLTLTALDENSEGSFQLLFYFFLQM